MAAMTFPSLTPTVNFCTQCGHRVEHRIPSDDTRIRAVCPACNTIHYENPKCVVNTISMYDNKVLLCLRAIEPRAGFWTLPGGFLECGETLAEGAKRETWEEACARIDLIEPVYALVDIPHIGQIHVFFRSNIIEQADAPLFAAGEETLETRLFALNEIPWDQLAFNSVRFALQSYVADATKDQFSTLHHTLTPSL
jgi:ADP-ribose pyrophosphatase YjhB (NUDIX family)